MTLYHMSDSLQLGDALNGDYMQITPLVGPFLQAMERSEDCFFAMLMHADYMATVLYRNNIYDWVNCVKWATEAIFEYVRKTEFPTCNSRILSNYFYDDLDFCRYLYAYDWADTKKEVRNRVHLYEIEVDQTTLEKRDMRIYDIAYETMGKCNDITAAKAYARRYFAGESTNDPVWEYLSEAPATAVRDVTEYLCKE